MSPQQTASYASATMDSRVYHGVCSGGVVQVGGGSSGVTVWHRYGPLPRPLPRQRAADATRRTRYPRSLAEAFPDERAAAVYGPYRRQGPLSRVLSWLEAMVRRIVRR